MTTYCLTPGVIVERVGDDLMVIVPGSTDVVQLSGPPADVLLDVQAGRKIDSTEPALRDLVDLGVVTAPGLSRRGLIKAGAIGAGAGIAVLAMPGVAAASSDGGNPPLDLVFIGIFGGANEPTFNTPAPANLNVPGTPVVTVSALLTNAGQAPVETKEDWTAYFQQGPDTWQIRMIGPGRNRFSEANTVRIELEFTYDNRTYNAVYVKP